MKKLMTPPKGEQPYGLRFYQQLKKFGCASHFNYADIQRLKQANRAETAKMFRGSSYAIVQLIKNEEPEEAAHLIYHQMILAGQSAAVAIICAI